jgi:hypothetical protein
MDMSVQLQAPSALPLEKVTWNSLNTRLCSFQSRVGRFEEENALRLPGIEPRSVCFGALRLIPYYPGNQIKKNEMGGTCGKHEEEESYRVMVEKPEEKRPFGRPTHRWKYKIRTDFQEIGWKGLDWIETRDGLL